MAKGLIAAGLAAIVWGVLGLWLPLGDQIYEFPLKDGTSAPQTGAMDESDASAKAVQFKINRGFRALGGEAEEPPLASDLFDALSNDRLGSDFYSRSPGSSAPAPSGRFDWEREARNAHCSLPRC